MSILKLIANIKDILIQRFKILYFWWFVWMIFVLCVQRKDPTKGDSSESLHDNVESYLKKVSLMVDKISALRDKSNIIPSFDKAIISSEVRLALFSIYVTIFGWFKIKYGNEVLFYFKKNNLNIFFNLVYLLTVKCKSAVFKFKYQHFKIITVMSLKHSNQVV